MTMVYARIADKTVADDYFAVTEKVEALYGQPQQPPADDEGSERRTREFRITSAVRLVRGCGHRRRRRGGALGLGR